MGSLVAGTHLAEGIAGSSAVIDRSTRCSVGDIGCWDGCGRPVAGRGCRLRMGEGSWACCRPFM